ncbi:MAG TPA: tRNA dihydrouridine synthase DusB, partial [candidate division Zixibacteria bacterium]|nr:tRNA dihydrouridine synthase DusB [candidate division Zixibacteria bacterium]
MSDKKLSLNGKVVSAPLANIAGSAYRAMALRYGAAIAYSEMISVDGLVRGNRRTLDMLRLREGEKPVCFQIFGHDPKMIYDAARIVAGTGCDMIDINFGCPAKKVVRNLSGAALMNDLELAEKLITAVVTAVDIPVSVKFRSGWNRESMSFIEFGKMAEACGASYLVLHPRTRASGFKGKSDWSKLKLLKESVGIDVIGSGDISTPEEAGRMIDETGCDYVMIGRAAMGAPWIFQRIDHYLRTGDDPGEPPLDQKIEIMLEFCRLMIDDFGERAACLKLRKHLAWFTRGWHNVTRIRPLMFSVENYRDIEKILYN